MEDVKQLLERMHIAIRTNDPDNVVELDAILRRVTHGTKRYHVTTFAREAIELGHLGIYQYFRTKYPKKSYYYELLAAAYCSRYDIICYILDQSDTLTSNKAVMEKVVSLLAYNFEIQMISRLSERYTIHPVALMDGTFCGVAEGGSSELVQFCLQNYELTKISIALKKAILKQRTRVVQTILEHPALKIEHLVELTPTICICNKLVKHIFMVRYDQTALHYGLLHDKSIRKLFVKLFPPPSAECVSAMGSHYTSALVRQTYIEQLSLLSAPEKFKSRLLQLLWPGATNISHNFHAAIDFCTTFSWLDKQYWQKVNLERLYTVVTTPDSLTNNDTFLILKALTQFDFTYLEYVIICATIGDRSDVFAEFLSKMSTLRHSITLDLSRLAVFCNSLSVAGLINKDYPIGNAECHGVRYEPLLIAVCLLKRILYKPS